MSESPNYNPDVLSCLANLSSDEVFTPPQLANQVLDLLPESLWTSPDTRVLDPVCKSGVFLREAAKRLDKGLERMIPNRQERIDHILVNQLFGIAITDLTALISRRTLYCSKQANGKYSVCSKFKNENGNIRFNPQQHSWKNGRCRFCGAPQSQLDRGDDYETHAYELIHTDNPEDIFKMKFDVIVGNPPYQLADGGHGRSASPIYHMFVEQAMKLNPRYLTMIIPSRWLGGGKGLNSFRGRMLGDRRIRKLVDHEDPTVVFPGIDIAGGVCFFLWDRDTPGTCEVTEVRKNGTTSRTRSLDEYDVFVRNGAAIPIMRAVAQRKEPTMNLQVSSRKPFGLTTTVRPGHSGTLRLRWQKGEGPYEDNEVIIGRDMIPKWKVITSYVGYDHAGNPGNDGRRRVFSKIDMLPPNAICNETYLVVGAYDSKVEAENLIGYMQTKFFRFLVSQYMYSHHITKEAYALVPILDMTQEWTDDKLYYRYGLTKSDRQLIESTIREMVSS